MVEETKRSLCHATGQLCENQVPVPINKVSGSTAPLMGFCVLCGCSHAVVAAQDFIPKAWNMYHLALEKKGSLTGVFEDQAFPMGLS